MVCVESLQALAERRLIGRMVREFEGAATPREAERYLSALRDLVLHADPSLDPERFDAWTQGCLRRSGLWLWEQPGTQAAHVSAIKY
ncbi:MAG: hypothetical protein ACHQ4H_00095 [Ktedonobacterales bacterium]|jgi:hypothetical protein